MSEDTDEFVRMMLEKAGKKEKTEVSLGLGLSPEKDEITQPFINSVNDDDIKKAKEMTKQIMDKII
ncbi:MAG: hypothetical protein ABIF40_04175 [archaeon]